VSRSQCTVVPHTIASSSDIKAALQHGALRTNIATLPASDVVSLLTELQRSPLALSTVLLQCVSSEGRRRGLPSGAKPGASKPSGPRLDLKSPDFITSQAAVAHRLRLQTSKVWCMPHVSTLWVLLARCCVGGEAKFSRVTEDV
jgi:hypothetical protein